mmetsp:Transcript_506/g.1949  ORF Transcript_506/g.1949 Transcript_506/m.1949 type:complete len:701 (+) Transcript_506:114-2216(+)
MMPETPTRPTRGRRPVVAPKTSVRRLVAVAVFATLAADRASAQSVVRWVAVDTASAVDVVDLVDGMTVDLADLPGRAPERVSVRVEATADVKRVDFRIDGAWVRSEGVEPFALFGDDRGPPVSYHAPPAGLAFAAGATYNISATLRDADRDEIGHEAVVVTFGAATPSIAGVVVVDQRTGADVAPLGATVTLEPLLFEGDDLNIRVDTAGATDFGFVRFALEDVDAGASTGYVTVHSDVRAPYLLFPTAGGCRTCGEWCNFVPCLTLGRWRLKVELLSFDAATASLTVFAEDARDFEIVARSAGCAACAPWAAAVAAASPANVVAQIVECVTSTASSNAATYAHRDAFVAAHQGNSSECGCDRNCREWPYLEDRCVTPRAYCAVRVAGAGFSLIASSAYAYGTRYDARHPRDLVAGEYAVMLGPASALSTLTGPQLDQRLDEAGVGPWVNLAIGAAGPYDFLRQWDAMEKIVANAKVVVVQAMALRSSQNFACPYDGCWAYERLQLWYAADDATRTAMEDDSLANALAEYAELLRRIDESACRVGGTPPPRKYFLWNSECPTSTGCSNHGLFPHWFHVADRIHAIMALDGWTAALDANYDDLTHLGYPTLPVNKCEVVDDTDATDTCAAVAPDIFAGCAWRDLYDPIPSCDHVTFRRESRNTTGCTKSCAGMYQPYYPNDYGQNRSFDVLLPVLAPLFAT